MREKSIWVRFTRVGFHHWPEAAQTLPERAYLADRHRHLFHFEVEVPVAHDERQIEFHHLRDDLCRFLPAEPIEFGSNSCEAIANQIVGYVIAHYQVAWCKVTVSEDSEAGATVKEYR